MGKFSLRRALGVTSGPAPEAPPEEVVQVVPERAHPMTSWAQDEAARLVADEEFRARYDLALTEPLDPLVDAYVNDFMADYRND